MKLLKIGAFGVASTIALFWVGGSAFAQTSDKTILERRAMEMRKFNTKDSQVVARTFQDTLRDIGFNHIGASQNQLMGQAFGNKYRMVWYIKKDKNNNLIARVLLSTMDKNYGTEEDYKNFWDAIGQSKFLENSNYTPAELR